MKRKTKTRSLFNREMLLDLGFMAMATMYVLVNGFEMPITDAALYSPAVLVTAFAGLYTVVRVIGLVLCATDSIGDWLAIRRSPLA